MTWGKPTVATSLANIDRTISALRVGESHDAFLAPLADVRANPAVDADELAAFVAANSWEARFDAPVSQIVDCLKSRTANHGIRP